VQLNKQQRRRKRLACWAAAPDFEPLVGKRERVRQPQDPGDSTPNFRKEQRLAKVSRGAAGARPVMTQDAAQPWACPLFPCGNTHRLLTAVLRATPPPPKIPLARQVMASAGVASRRRCEELIEEGRVAVNGQVGRECATGIQ
jgi:hypothetical protein